MNADKIVDHSPATSDVVATLIKVGPDVKQDTKTLFVDPQWLKRFRKPIKPGPIPAEDCDFGSLGTNRFGLSPEDLADLDRPGVGEADFLFDNSSNSEHEFGPDDSPFPAPIAAPTTELQAPSVTAATTTTPPTSSVQSPDKQPDFGTAEPLTALGRPETTLRIDQAQVDYMLRDALRSPAFFARARTQLSYDHFDAAVEPQYRVLWYVVSLIAEKNEQLLFGDPLKVRGLMEAETRAYIANNPEEITPEFERDLFETDKKSIGLIPWIYESDARELNPEASCEYLKRFLLVRHVQEHLIRLLADARARPIVNMQQLLQEYAEEVEKIEAVDNDDAAVYCGRPVDATLLLSEPLQDDYLISDFLVAGEILAVGGQLKSFKTSFATDMSYALATGTKFLGHFTTPTPRKVLLISGETGKRPIRGLLQRLIDARGAAIPENRLHIEFITPRLDQESDLRALERAIKRYGPEVVILDPFYLAVADAEHANLFEMGSVLVKAAKKIKKAGATPVICHHVSMSAARESRRDGRNLTIADLAYAGLSHAAGQWCMITTHGEGYDPMSGRGAVWLHVGSRAGHGGAYLVEIDEGSVVPGQGRKKWEIKVYAGGHALEEANKQAQAKQEQKKSAMDGQLEEEMMHKVVAHLKQRPQGDTEKGIREAFLFSSGCKAHLAIKVVLAKGISAGWLKSVGVPIITAPGKIQQHHGVALQWDPTIPFAAHPTVAGSGS